MSNWFRTPLTRGEIFGYFLSLAGFVISQVHGPRDGLLEVAVIIMVVGTLIAARSGRRSKSAIQDAQEDETVERVLPNAPVDASVPSQRVTRERSVNRKG
ncbi:MAG TPA: hypothetical protein VK636_15915 [Gemmatimonadaceae bacterium]|nr:hypothetical protein [Gemmatimonadaceae bacterium]